MSDPNGTNENQTGTGAEFLGPERNQRAEAPARKEPPVIEGEAEVVGGDGSSPSASSSSAGSSSENQSPNSADRSSPISASGLGIAIAAGVAGALAVGIVVYALGFGRMGSGDAQALADLDARIASVETKSAESGTRLTSAEEKLAAATQSADSATAIGARLDKIERDAAALRQSLSDAAAAPQIGRAHV